MKYNKIRNYSIPVILAIMGLIFSPTAWAENAAETESQEDKQDISKELHVMSKVLEESLNRTSLKNDWKGIPMGTSIFDPVIKYQYIPTVGAIFTIPVSFLIIEPEAPAEVEKVEEKPEEEETDLWKKFSEDKGRQGEYRVQINPYSMDPMIDSAIQEKMKDIKANLKDEEEKIKKTIGRPDLSVFVSDASPPPPPYKKEQFDTLRNTILANLAQYGHHLKSLNETERILVIIEAPSSRGEKTPKDPVQLLKTERRVGFSSYGALRDPMLPPPASSVFDISGPYPRRDRCLFAVVKGAIQGEMDPMDLGGKIEEIFY